MDNISVFKLTSVSRSTYDGEIQTYFGQHLHVPPVSWLWVTDTTIYGYNLLPIHLEILHASTKLATLVEKDVSDFVVPSYIPQSVTEEDRETGELVQVPLYNIVSYWEEQL
jgi:hypothetical protein